jgi:hypothetical protein
MSMGKIKLLQVDTKKEDFVKKEKDWESKLRKNIQKLGEFISILL